MSDQPSPGAQLSNLRAQIEHVCPHCGTVFPGVKIAKYCTDKCRMAAHAIKRTAARRAAKQKEEKQP